MVTLTVEIQEEKDLPVLQALLNRLDLKYHIDDETHQLSETELAGINAGLEDLTAGKVHTMAEVQSRITQKINSFRAKTNS
jgi:predicted transcriptional regulator